MKKIILSLLAVLVVLAVMGCTSVYPRQVTNNSVGSKVGESSGTIILGGIFGANVDYSLQTAAQNGGINKIATVDLRVKNFWFGRTYTTIVTGE